MGAYSFVTVWEIPAPLEPVWNALLDADRWPDWWRGLERVALIRPSVEPHQVGSVREFRWKSVLPYRLTVSMRLTRVEPRALMESAAEGELEGTGRWTLSGKGSGVRVQYDWNVRTTQPWMNRLEWAARPVFRWNHDVLMRWGGEGLARLFRVE